MPFSNPIDIFKYKSIKFREFINLSICKYVSIEKIYILFTVKNNFYFHLMK